MNAWWRQLGHSSAWAPTRRVRRTIRRSVRGFRERLRALVVMVLSATWAYPPRV